MQTIESLSDQLQSYLSPEQIAVVQRAYYYAEQAHDGQMRRSGEPYVTHPLAVSFILADMHLDYQTLTAALLHDVIEDTGIPKEAIAKQFSPTVAELVDGVSKLGKIDSLTRAERQADDFQKMAMAMAKDIRVILVKIADRLHNMRTLGVMRPEQRRRKARETLDIYAPIANRLGMNDVRIAFEDMGFETLYPWRSAVLKKRVQDVYGHRKDTVNTIEQNIATRVEAEGISAQVSSRQKHLYSIYHKMLYKKRHLKEITDVFGFRVVVDTPDECYRTLGIIHSLYKPVPGNIKDYIAIPKANGYQSLHTVLFSSTGTNIEVQIRTKKMDDMANKGVAAHHLYKTGEDGESDSQTRARQWIKEVLDLQKYAGDSVEFLESVKINLFPDEVYVFTPDGTIMSLPANSTALDFAYAVHSDIGNHFSSCRINRKWGAMSQILENGQTVEIVTSPGIKPDPQWLRFVVTGKARTAIKHYLKQFRLDESAAIGRSMLNTELAKHSTDVDNLSAPQINQLLAAVHCESLDALFEEIGQGSRVASLTAHILFPDHIGQDNEPHDTQKPMAINGTEGLLVEYGTCCSPIPGDQISGRIDTERGIVIHRSNCNHLMHGSPSAENTVPMLWANDVSGEYAARLQIRLRNRRGLFAEVAGAINNLRGNIESIDTREQDANSTVLDLTISIANRRQLADIVRRVRTISDVSKVIRPKKK